MRVLFILILALAGTLPALASTMFPTDDHYERVLAEEAAVSVDCAALEQARVLCERIKTARLLAGQVALKTFIRMEGKAEVPYRDSLSSSMTRRRKVSVNCVSACRSM